MYHVAARMYVAKSSRWVRVSGVHADEGDAKAFPGAGGREVRGRCLGWRVKGVWVGDTSFIGNWH